MNKYSVVFVLFFKFTFSQEIKGMISDSQSLQKLPYGNIGVLNSKSGTSTNIDGEFYLDVSSFKQSDSLIISYLSYESKTISVSDFLKLPHHNILLNPLINELDEVLISNKSKEFHIQKKLKIKRKKKSAIHLKYGSELVAFLENKDQSIGVLETLKIYFNKLETKYMTVKPAIFKVNFYTVNENQFKPDKPLNKQLIIIKPENKTYQYNLDLKAYKIPLPKKGIFVGLEFINPGINVPKKKYTTTPGMVTVKGKKQLSFYRFYGGKWFKSGYRKKINSSYYNILVELSIKV